MMTSFLLHTIPMFAKRSQDDRPSSLRKYRQVVGNEGAGLEQECFPASLIVCLKGERYITLCASQLEGSTHKPLSIMTHRLLFIHSISLAACLTMSSFQSWHVVTHPKHQPSMTQKISPIIKPEELKALKDNYVLIDARAGAPDVKDKYLESHLKGALFVDLDHQLADIKPNAAHGGRHPLPEPQKFAEVLMQLGIGPTSHVVVYDDKNGANAAARFWWMMRSIGHEKIQVLDGGMQAAVAAGFPTG